MPHHTIGRPREVGWGGLWVAGWGEGRGSPHQHMTACPPQRGADEDAALLLPLVVVHRAALQRASGAAATVALKHGNAAHA